MQTFVPYTSPEKCAQVLDVKRLGKQRVEALQLLKAIHTKSGWNRHPAAKMWHNHEYALIDYGLAICEEWIGRGYKDTCWQKINSYVGCFPDSSLYYPDWWGNEEVHHSHQSNLVRKMPEWYGKFGWLVQSDKPYVWTGCTYANCSRCD